MENPLVGKKLKSEQPLAKCAKGKEPDTAPTASCLAPRPPRKPPLCVHGLIGLPRPRCLGLDAWMLASILHSLAWIFRTPQTPLQKKNAGFFGPQRPKQKKRVVVAWRVESQHHGAYFHATSSAWLQGPIPLVSYSLFG